MPAFRRVADVRAGASALGILVPPGARTLVILRPRALSWDLVPMQAEDVCHFDRDKAASLAREVHRGLEAAAGLRNRLQVGVDAVASGFHAWLSLCGFRWVVCSRVPGAPYQPFVFTNREHAQEALKKLLSFCHPAEDAEQEYYFNTQNFAG